MKNRNKNNNRNQKQVQNKPKQQSKPRQNGNGSSAGRAAFQTAGGAIGTALGGPLGGALGTIGGGLLSKIFGMGAYSVNSNSITNSNVPHMHSTSSNIRIRHKEFIKDITATTSFSVENFRVNPGLSDVFPFLSGIARNFESYRIHGLVFCFKSNSADALNSTNTALGTMIFATKYDVLGEDFTNKQGMEATQFSNSARPSESQLHPIECAPAYSTSLQRYVRSGDLVSADGDARLYDWCKMSLASQGVQATSVVGELWVTYDIEFLNPISTVPRGLGLKTAKFRLTTVTDAAPLGSGSAVEDLDMIGLTLTATTISIPAGSYGTYLLAYNVFGTNTASCACTFSNTTNVSDVLFFQANAAAVSNNNSTTTTTYITEKCFKLTDPTQAAVITLSSATLPASATAGGLVITQINGQLA